MGEYSQYISSLRKDSVTYKIDFPKLSELLQDDHAEQFKEEYEKLKDALYRFIDNAFSNRNMSFGLNDLVSNWINDSDNYDVFTFNYTNVANVLFNNNIKHKLEYNQLIQKEVHSQHLHGSTDHSGKIIDGMVLGIDESMEVGDPIYHRFLYKSENDVLKNHGYTNALKNADRIVLFGCSIGISDYWYFEKLFQIQTPKLYEIYYYGDSEKRRIKEKIHELSKMKWMDFKDLHDLIWIDSCIRDLSSEREIAYANYFRDSLY